MTGMTNALQLAIEAYQDLRGRTSEAKPDGVSDKWWKSYVEARDAINPDAERGQRGVTATGLADEAAEGADGAEPKAEIDGEVTIKIYGPIERWTLQDFDWYLSRAGSRPVRVRIASPGGDAGVGLQIYTMIRKRGGVVTEADGPIASAASVIFLAGQARLVPEEAASVMVHRSWLLACMAGNVSAWKGLLSKIENVLSVIDDGMAAVLKARIGGTKKAAMAYLDAETYFTPEQCVKNGIATGYCEYADEGETDPQEGENVNEGDEEEDERMQTGKLPAGQAKAEETASVAETSERDAKSESEPEEDSGEEAKSGEKSEEKAAEESKSSEAEEPESGEKEDDADMQSSATGAAPEAAASENAAQPSEADRPQVHSYPMFLRDEL